MTILLIKLLCRLLKSGAYAGNERAFDRLADSIRLEEKAAYYSKHPEGISHVNYQRC